MRSLSILLLLFSISGVTFAQGGESPELDKKKLEWSGNFDAKYTAFHMDRESPMYKLQFFNTSLSSSYLTQYRLEPYLNADYRTGDLGFSLKMHAAYYNDEETKVDLFEAYGSFSPSFNTTLQAGKRVYSWGKGYAFNPVGFVNPVKDPENPELAQSGLLSANVDFIKSFSSDALQSLALTLVVIPSTDLFSSRYGEMGKTDVALKTYFLLWDTDIDVMAYYSKDKPKRYGLDFARNLQENIEIHGELGFYRNMQRYSIRNGALRSESADNTSYLIGVRYLNENNTTIIAEYYHQGGGMSKEEYEEYNRFLANASTSSITQVVQQSLGIAQTYFRGSNLMRKYLYLKLTQPEPFDWLYFTPSVYSIYNLSDKSLLVSLSMSYKPITNIEFIIWPTVLVGGSTTEYGGKQVQERIELWMRVHY